MTALFPVFFNYGFTLKTIIPLEIGNALKLRGSNADILQWPCALDIINLSVESII